MATHVITGSFTGTGALAESGGGLKKRKAVTTPQVPGSFVGTGSLSLDATKIKFKRNITSSFTLSGNTLSLDIDDVLITRSQVWWDKTYLYRRVLQIQPNAEGFEVDHPLHATLGRDLIRQNKVRSDVADIEVLRLVSSVPEIWALVPKKVELLDTSIKVSWPSQSEIAANTLVKDLYYIYYGNSDLVNYPIQLDEYAPIDYPVSLPYSNGALTYTRPGEHWQQDIAKEDGAKVTLEFYGSQVRVLANIGPSWGIAEVQIDNEEWVQVDLYNPTELSDQVVFTKTSLPIGSHYIRYRRSGFKAASATDYQINIQAIEYLRHNMVANVSEEADETLMWGSTIGGVVGNK